MNDRDHIFFSRQQEQTHELVKSNFRRTKLIKLIAKIVIFCSLGALLLQTLKGSREAVGASNVVNRIAEAATKMSGTLGYTLALSASSKG